MWKHVSLVTPRTTPGSACADNRPGAERLTRSGPHISARARRRLVASLRRAVNRSRTSDTVGPWRGLMLRNRVATVSADLLEIAARLEVISDPDPATCGALHRLLTDGCESPLYNPAVHPSELAAVVYYAKQHLPRPQGGLDITDRSQLAQSPGEHTSDLIHANRPRTRSPRG